MEYSRRDTATINGMRYDDRLEITLDVGDYRPSVRFEITLPDDQGMSIEVSLSDFEELLEKLGYTRK